MPQEARHTPRSRTTVLHFTSQYCRATVGLLLEDTTPSGRIQQPAASSQHLALSTQHPAGGDGRSHSTAGLRACTYYLEGGRVCFPGQFPAAKLLTHARCLYVPRQRGRLLQASYDCNLRGHSAPFATFAKRRISDWKRADGHRGRRDKIRVDGHEMGTQSDRGCRMCLWWRLRGERRKEERRGEKGEGEGEKTGRFKHEA